MFNPFRKNKSGDRFDSIKQSLRDHQTQFSKIRDQVPADIFDITNFFFEEALEIYDAMDILVNKNHFRGCLQMSRSLFENAINLQYIYKTDSERRAKNFKLASMASFQKRYADMKDESPLLNQLKGDIKNLLKDYVPERKTLRNKAEELGSGSIYKDAYKRLSEYIHSEYKQKRDFEVEGPYTTHLKRVVFSDTLLVTLDAMKQICERFDLEGGVMVIDEPAYIGTVFFSTNPKHQENDEKVLKDWDKKTSF